VTIEKMTARQGKAGKLRDRILDEVARLHRVGILLVRRLSLSDYIASNADRPATFLGQNADQLTQKGGQDFLGSAPKIQQGLDDLSQIFIDAGKKWKSANIFDSTADHAQADILLAALAGKIKGATDSALGAQNKGAVGTDARSASYKLPEGDRLAKVGLFIGGATASPGLSEARRTAAGVEKSSKTLDAIKTLLGKPLTKAPNYPVYA
jgi:hypothetical protein